jgi:ribosomal protein L32
MSQDRTVRTELPGQNFQYRAARIGLPAQDCKDKTTRSRTERRRRPEKDRHVRHLEQDSQTGAARMRQTEQDCQDRITRTGLPAQGC